MSELLTPEQARAVPTAELVCWLAKLDRIEMAVGENRSVIYGSDFGDDDALYADDLVRLMEAGQEWRVHPALERAQMYELKDTFTPAYRHSSQPDSLDKVVRVVQPFAAPETQIKDANEKHRVLTILRDSEHNLQDVDDIEVAAKALIRLDSDDSEEEEGEDDSYDSGYDDYDDDTGEPRDYLEAALLAWEPGSKSAKEIVETAMEMAGLNPPFNVLEIEELAKVVSELIKNDTRTPRTTA